MKTLQPIGDFEKFEEHFWPMRKQELVNHLWEMYLHCQNLQNEVESLQEQANQRNVDYLSRCRSSGGVTLPPGV